MTRTPTLLLSLCAAALAMQSSVAEADVVRRPPDDCPVGTIGRSNHSGEWCAPTTCTADADCASIGVRQALFGTGDHTYVCRPIDLCVRSETYTLGGLRPPGGPQTGTRSVGSACSPSCDAPAACTHEDRCVLASLVDPPPPPAPPTVSPPTKAPRTTAPSTTAPSGAASAPSGGMCSISARTALGSSSPTPFRALAVIAVLALVTLRRTRRRARRLPLR